MDSTKVLKEAMTAYEAVYNQDLRVELEEKQAFENWVNSLVEEGYDLSEYTWEDMYGIYTSESLIGDVLANRGKIGSAVGKVASGIGRASNAAVNQLGTSTRNIARTAKNVVTSAPVRAAASGFNRSGLVGAVTGAVGATAAKPAAAAKPPATTATKPAAAAKPPATTATKPAAAAKPAATTPTARPAATAAARPTAAPKPAAAPAAKPAPTATATPSSATPAAPKRTFNPLMQKTFGYQTGYAPDQVKGDIKKMAQMGSLKAGFDLFDVVKGHLLDEGYADTEEAALAIMANMSEEWRDSIISEAPGEWFGGLRDKARASRAAQIQSMQPTPKPGPNVSSPFAKPASKTDSGKLTTYGAGGGAAAERRGQTRSQVIQQGAKNLETKNKTNPGPNFGR